MDNIQNSNYKLTSQKYLDLVQRVMDKLVLQNEQKKAFQLSKSLENALEKNMKELDGFSDIVEFYRRMIIRGKFIALPLLSNLEIVNLFERYFTRQFELEDYDLMEKFRYKLINIEVYEDRDRFREEVKRMLLDNELVIAGNSEIKKIKDWLKDYNVKLGTGQVDKLKQTQYFTDLRRKKELTGEEIRRLIILFKFYEILKYSTYTPQGHEEDTSVVVNGKLYIFKRGELEPVFVEEKHVTGPPKTAEEKEIEGLKEEEKKYRPGGLEALALEEEVEDRKKIEELEIMAKKYKDNSLERKAILEEIEKLKKRS